MSRRYTKTDDTKAELSVLRTVGKTLTNAATDESLHLEHAVQRTGEALVILSGYMAYRIELMNELFQGRPVVPFVQKLRNRSNGIVRACDEFNKTIEPYIEGDERHKAYLFFSDVIGHALDSLFEDMHQEEPEATLQVTRRAKLRYHDPYPEHVKECTAAFEDGYTKGYTDAMADFIKEVAKLGETSENLTVGIVDGKININPIEQ